MQRTAGVRMLALLAAMASAGGVLAVRASPASESIAEQAPHGAKTTAGKETASNACEKGPRTAFGDFLGVPEHDQAFASALKGAHFQTVLVTIPDPIDSRLDADFDETLAALSLSAAIRGYALDHYWLPWQLDRRQLEATPSPGPDGCRPLQPGVILFRATANIELRPLAFLLVGETPTTGIHRIALERALEIVDAAGEKNSARVLGPSFSGTAPSLARELGRQRYNDWTFKIVTGSATAGKSLNILDKQKPGAAKVSLQSTVHTDESMWVTLTEFLNYLHINLDDVALLIESDTAYGAHFTRAARDLPPRRSASEASAREHRFRTVIRFPAQVSRIRSDYERQRVRQHLTIGSYNLPPEALELRGDTNHDPKDVLPALSSASENYEEEVLAADLESLRKHPVRAVGVLATDPLDKTFLVSKLREFAPDALIFTFESSQLFLHPDVRRAMYGSLVVSTYPLFVEAQSWTTSGPPIEQIQFASSDAEGTYNAAVLLLAEPETARRELLDYECPFPTRLPPVGHPPVWISVIGQDALWPVWIGGCGDGKPPLADVSPTAPSPRPRRVHAPHASRGMLLFAGFLALFAAANAVATFATRGLVSRHLRHLLRPYAPPRVGSTRSHWAWLMAHLLWLALVVLAMAVILSIPDAAGLDSKVPETHPDWTHFMAGLAAAVTGLVVVAAGWAGWDLARSHPRRDRGASAADAAMPTLIASAWARLAAGAMACAMALAVMFLLAPALAHFAMRTSEERTWTLLLFERAVHLGSGVCPMLPLLFPALAIHLWTHHQLMRIHLLEDQDVGTGDLLFRRFAGGDDPVLTEADRRLMGLVRGRFSRRELALTLAFALPAVAVLCYAYYFFHSPDGPGFDRLFVVLLASAIIIAGSSLLRAWRLWIALRAALERLPLYPIGKALERLPDVFRQQRLQRLFLRGPQYEDLHTSYDVFRKAFPLPARAETHRRVEQCLRKDRRAPLRARWDHASLIALADAAAAESRAGPPSCAHVTAVEDFVASQLALKVFWVLAHLRWRVAYSVLSAVAILGAVAFYPFQPHPSLLLLTWIVVLGAAVSAVVIYVQHSRNEVLSWLSRTTPGRVSLDAGHLIHFVTLGAAPILALLAFQFPAFGHWLAGWLGPIFGAIK